MEIADILIWAGICGLLLVFVLPRILRAMGLLTSDADDDSSHRS